MNQKLVLMFFMAFTIASFGKFDSQKTLHDAQKKMAYTVEKALEKHQLKAQPQTSVSLYSTFKKINRKGARIIKFKHP
jgi:hypothetical protein